MTVIIKLSIYIILLNFIWKVFAVIDAYSTQVAV